MSPLGRLTESPMEIDLVLENIFQFCDAPSLKNCRLVSHKWRKLSLKAWRAKAVLQLKFYRGSWLKLGFTDFLVMTDSEDEDGDPLLFKEHPFKRYSIEFDDWPMSGFKHKEQRGVAVAISQTRPLYLRILWNCSRFDGIDDFLSSVIADSSDELEVIWSPFAYEMPEQVEPLNFRNVRRLKLFTRSLFVGYYGSEYSPYGFLLETFPNLEALSVGYGLDETDDRDYSGCLTERLEIASLLKTLRTSGSREEGLMPYGLKEFEMIDFNNQQKMYEPEFQSREFGIIKALAECQFPLEKLTIHVGYQGGRHEEEKIPILPLLKSCKDTLKYLKASIGFNDWSCSTELRNASGGKFFELEPASNGPNICMVALEEVKLLNGLEWAMYFLTHLDIPQLEKLIVNYEKSHNPLTKGRLCIASLSFHRRIYEQLETFELHDNYKIPHPTVIEVFATMMPNLVHLTIPLDKRAFQMVCEQFKGLKTMNILEGQSDYVELDDEVLTGVSKAQLLELEEGGMLSRRPNITNLEHLSDLSISCQRQLKREDVKFTDHSVMYGFLQLPRLYNLSVAIKEMSEQMCEKLLAHVKGNVHFQLKKEEPPSSSFMVEEYVSDCNDDDWNDTTEGGDN